MQASYKFGGALQNLLNVRADEPAELKANVDAIDDDVVSSIVNLGARLGTVAPVAEALATPTATPPAAAPAAPAPAAGTRTCSHGPRQVVHTQKWTGYFCALPKGTPGACKAQFEDPS